MLSLPMPIPLLCFLLSYLISTPLLLLLTLPLSCLLLCLLLALILLLPFRYHSLCSLVFPVLRSMFTSSLTSMSPLSLYIYTLFSQSNGVIILTLFSYLSCVKSLFFSSFCYFFNSFPSLSSLLLSIPNTLSRYSLNMLTLKPAQTHR